MKGKQTCTTQIAITVIDTIYHALDIKLHWNYNPCYPDYKSNKKEHRKKIQKSIDAIDSPLTDKKQTTYRLQSLYVMLVQTE